MVWSIVVAVVARTAEAVTVVSGFGPLVLVAVVDVHSMFGGLCSLNQLSVVVAFLVEVGNVVLLVVLLAVGLVAELLFVLEAVVEFVVLEILMLCTSAEPL